MNLYEDTLNIIESRKYRAENNQINCIPFGIPHLRNVFPGIEKSTYLVVTGGSKSGKSQITNFLVLYNAIFYAYNHPDQLKVKFLYFPLEESAEIVTLRFISFLLYTKYGKRISPMELLSSNTDKPVPTEIVRLIKGDYIQNMVKFFDECVDFYEGVNTSVGITINVENYAKTHGKLVYNDKIFIDENGEEKHCIDHYEPNDPDEYVHVLIDHCNLLNPTKGEGSMLNAISNLSKSMVSIKNKYKYVIVALAQQTDSETNSLEAVKQGNVLATKAGIKDCKQLGQDLTLLWGISNPGSFQNLDEWHHYRLDRFKRKYFRVFEIIMNRFGEGNITVPLFFDGAVNYYIPLPAATKKLNDKEIENTDLTVYYNKIAEYEQSRIVTAPQSTMFYMNSY